MTLTDEQKNYLRNASARTLINSCKGDLKLSRLAWKIDSLRLQKNITKEEEKREIINNTSGRVIDRTERVLNDEKKLWNKINPGKPQLPTVDLPEFTPEVQDTNIDKYLDPSQEETSSTIPGQELSKELAELLDELGTCKDEYATVLAQFTEYRRQVQQHEDIINATALAYTVSFLQANVLTYNINASFSDNEGLILTGALVYRMANNLAVSLLGQAFATALSSVPSTRGFGTVQSFTGDIDFFSIGGFQGVGTYHNTATVLDARQSVINYKLYKPEVNSEKQKCLNLLGQVNQIRGRLNLPPLSALF